jgi:hypothetical protein
LVSCDGARRDLLEIPARVLFIGRGSDVRSCCCAGVIVLFIIGTTRSLDLCATWRSDCGTLILVGNFVFATPLLTPLLAGNDALGTPLRVLACTGHTFVLCMARSWTMVFGQVVTGKWDVDRGAILVTATRFLSHCPAPCQCKLSYVLYAAASFGATASARLAGTLAPSTCL